MSAQEPTNVLEEVDRLKLALLNERGVRIEAQAQHFQLIQARLRAEQAQLSEEHAKVNADLGTKYNLREHDAIDLKTGAIERAPVVPEAPKKLEIVPKEEPCRSSPQPS